MVTVAAQLVIVISVVVKIVDVKRDGVLLDAAIVPEDVMPMGKLVVVDPE